MIGCTALCWLVPAELVGVFTRDGEVLAYGRQYLTIFTLSNAFVGMIMVMGAAFQGLGKTYPSLVGAIIDNTIYAALVFSLPIIFGWGIVSIWWIKVTATVFETALVALWLKRDLGRISTGELATPRPSQPFAAATEKRSDT
jgi:Na+-driven multidrug efflux pump